MPHFKKPITDLDGLLTNSSPLVKQEIAPRFWGPALEKTMPLPAVAHLVTLTRWVKYNEMVFFQHTVAGLFNMHSAGHAVGPVARLLHAFRRARHDDDDYDDDGDDHDDGDGDAGDAVDDHDHGDGDDDGDDNDGGDGDDDGLSIAFAAS